jgi:site-specific recombinase XerC
MGLSPGGASGLPQLKIYMSLYRRGRVWWLELTSNGRRVRESTGTADKKAAQEYHEKRKGELWRQARLGEPEPVTWGEAVKAWMAVKERSLSERYMLRSLGITLSQTLPLPTSTVEDCLSGMGSGTANRYLNLIVAVHSAVGFSPPSFVRPPQSAGRTRWLSSEEWSRLRKALDAESPILRQAAEFTLATGLRENNVLNLEWRQVSLEARHLAVEAPDIKGRAPLGVPLTDAACAVLEARRGLHKKYVFANPDTGLPYYKASNRAWYAAVKKAKLKGLRWHDLRHTWAAWAVQSGVSLQELMHLGGWKTYSMVLRYAHLSSEHLAQAAARIKPISLSYNARKRGKRGTKSPTVGA